MKNKNQFLSILFVLFMGFGYPLIRYITSLATPININTIMFLSGGTLFLLITLFRAPREFLKLKEEPKLIINLFLIAFCTSGNMYCFVAGMSKTSALAGSIFGLLSMPFSIIAAALFFSDERKRATNRNFAIGTLIAIIGSIIFIFAGSQASNHSNDFLFGIFLLALTLVIQAMQALFVKDSTQDVDSGVVSSTTSLLTGLIYLILGVVTGDFYEILSSSFKTIATISVTGMYANFVGMVLTFYIIQTQGVVVLNVLRFLIPPATAIIGYFFLAEAVLPLQFLGGIGVLLGCVLALKNDNK